MNNKILVKSILIVLAAVSMTACSRLPKKYQFIRNNHNDYRSAYTTKPLELPPGYDSSKFDSYMVVPNPQLAKKAKPVDLVPPDLNPKKIPEQKHWWDSL